MAQLKDTIVSGNLRVTDTTLTDTLQVTTIKAPTSSGESTYGPGTSGQVLKSNGTTVYWGSDSNSVTGVKGNAESSYRTGNVNLTPANIGALALSGGTMTGNITFTPVTSTSYPASSNQLYWSGSTDWAKIYYRVDASDAGKLVFDIGDDTNTRIAFAYNGTAKSYIDTDGNFSGNAANVTGTVAIAHGGTGATTRLAALRALTEENVGTSAQYFLTITNSWGKGGYTSVGNAKTVLGLKSAAYTESSDYVPNTKNGVNAAINLLDTGSSTPTDADYYISQYVNGGTTTTTYHRRPMSALWSYVKGKADSVYSPIGHTHSQYLPKTTYEWNKEISFGNSGYLKIGSFPMYDTNITIDINATTSKTYHGTVVIATQNVSTTSMGSHKIHVYDDPTGNIATSLRIVWTSGSRNYDIYFVPQSWSKNFIHIRALGNYMDGATDICVSQTGTAPTTTSGLEPVNILSVTSTGDGNAVTKVEIDSVGNLVVTKGSTFLTEHPTIIKSADTTSTVSPAHGGTFTVVDSITRETNGHVTKINTKTVTLPADSNTDTKVKVTASTSKAYLIGTTTSPGGTAVEGVGNTGVYMTNGVLTASSIHGSGTENQSTAPTGGYRIYDCRSVNVSPNDGDKAANFYFHMADMPNTSLWWSVLHMRGWTGAYSAWEIAGPSDSKDQRTNPLYVRTSNTNTAWGSWRKIYDTSNPPTASEVGALASTTKYAGSDTVGGAATNVAIARVAKDSKVFPGANKVVFEEYVNGTSYNLPSNHFYHIMSAQGSDVKYGTQLALGMTTTAAYYRVYIDKTWSDWKSLINTDTNTTYTIATGDSNGQIKVTPSSGSAYNVSVKGLGSAAYTASTSYVPINGKAPNGIGRDGYVAYAHDGFLNNGTGTVTGALVITTPFTKTKGEVMLKFTVDIFNYNSNTSVEYKISGYAYNDGKWYNCTAYCVSSGVYSTDNIDNLTVRFGYVTDGFYQVQIGETTTNKWNYPRINVHDISVTYSRTNYTDANSGWSLEFVTSGNIPNITQTITNTAQRYLPLSGGTMTGTIQGEYPNTHIALAGGGIGDCANLAHKNDINISSWCGVSISNGCSNAGTLDQVTFSVNARSGLTQQRGNAVLYSASGDSPALIFQRGTFVDELNDWKIYVSGGALYFAQSTANASSEKWTNKMYFHASDGNLYVGSTRVSLNGHTHSYLPLSGGTMTGTITHPANTVAINLRDHGTSTWQNTIMTQNAGDEAVVFANANARTSWMFVNGEDSIAHPESNRWQSLTPALQIKGGCVAIGKLIPNGTTPTTRLDIAGSTALTGDIQLKTSGSSSDDSGDIVWYYGNGKEKMRLWSNDTYTAKSGPNFRVYKSDETLLFNGTLSLSDHTHNYAGSSSAGGAATSANKLNTDAGTTSIPVYFSGGVPVQCTTPNAYQTNTTTNADYRVLFSTNANDTTQSGTTRKNINLQYNPSTATLKIGDYVSGSTATKNGKLVFGNSLNVYTHTINTNTDKLSNVSLTLNSTDGIMGTDALCYKGYESANLSSDTAPGSLADISSLSNAVSFSGYLARFSYFTVLLCVGTDVTARTTVQVSAIAGYQSYQLIWGGAPNHSGGNLSITSGLVNISESSGTITLNFGKCASYWQFSSSSSTPTKGTTPNIHVLKVYGHSIRSNGYH